jgi:type 2 lantibiotic biosynthesis protein LanM
MQYSAAQLRSLAARAMPLQQRAGRVYPTAPLDPNAVQRLDRWRETLSIEGDEGVLAQRLALDGLDSETCLGILGDVRLPEGEPCPSWLKRLNHVLRAYAGRQVPGQLEPMDLIAPSLFNEWELDAMPFAAVWIPFVAGATQEWRARAGANLRHLSDSVVGTFQAHFLCALSHVASLPLSLEFRRAMAKHDPLSVLGLAAAVGSTQSRDAYDRFVDELKGGGLLGFFEQYADLARLMTGLAGHWADSMTEFCQRVEEDRTALAEKFNKGEDLGNVAQVKIGVSDPHHGRRDVIIASFASGLKLVYKPKDLGIDEAFWSFVDWLNRSAADEDDYLPLRTLRVLNRGTHGWVEFVEDAACGDREAMQRYYRRVGMLLGVAYVLGATDFHQDNVIASGEQPVLVDLETLLQPLPRSFDAVRTDSADERAIEIMHDSVLRIGLLPFWIAGDRGRSYDVSGIGAEGVADTGYLQIDWHAPNSDAMCPVYRNLASEQAAKRPAIEGAEVSARNYVAEIIRGFTCCYRELLSHRDALVARDGPLTRFGGVRVRCLVRMTKAYAQLMDRRLHPEFLRDAADGGIELERLARDFLVMQPDPHQPLPWDIFHAELRALERLDIPAFTFLSDSETIYSDGRPLVQGFFSATGLQRATSIIARLGEADLRVQTGFIRASLHARYAGDDESASSQPSVEDAAATDDANVVRLSQAAASIPLGKTNDFSATPATPEQLVAAAVSIAEKISRAAIRGSDGGATWLSMAYDPTVDRMNFLPMTDNLYDGRTGVALFLAAVEHVSGGAEFRDLALAALLPLRKALRQRIPAPVFRIGLGGAAGLGSWVYALVRIAGWLKDDELLRLAERAAGWFAPRRIAADENLDVFGGAAGGIVGLLALADGHRSEPLERAVQCGDHLLRRRIPTDGGHRAWQGRLTPRPLTGFAHGAAGIGCALLRLGDKTGESRFRDAAEEAMAFETSVYSPELGNWPDFRVTREDVVPMVAWCNGATGIGLGRLSALPLLDTGAVRQDIEHALAATCADAFDGEDHLCCGNAGRLDLLMEAGRRLNRTDLWQEARRRADALVRRSDRKERHPHGAQGSDESDRLSLFQGIAGIGYQFLRLAKPGQLPSVLLWD